MSDAFALVETAISRWQADPELGIASLASGLGVSSSALDRAFQRCAGIAPKRFQQVVAVERARLVLRHASVLDAALLAGASGPGRLHDRCVLVEGLSPGELKSGGEHLELRWGGAATPLGLATLAWSTRGIHRLQFGEPDPEELTAGCPQARLVEDEAQAGTLLDAIFASERRPFRVSVVGSRFQIAVWRGLLSIPPGATATYAQLAAAIGRPRAVRAVGSACGANPVALLIPCHRVIQASGALGGYRWGAARKACLIASEAAMRPAS